jgi:hypothetical protein
MPNLLALRPLGSARIHRTDPEPVDRTQALPGLSEFPPFGREGHSRLRGEPARAHAPVTCQPCAQGGGTSAQRFRYRVPLHPRQPGACRTGETSRRMAVQRRHRARLPEAASVARRFLAEVLEALRAGEASRRREDSSPSNFVAADVRRLHLKMRSAEFGTRNQIRASSPRLLQEIGLDEVLPIFWLRSPRPSRKQRAGTRPGLLTGF